MIELELLDLVDENGVPTGEVKERELVHRDGDRHRTSHVWLFRRWNGQWQVLLQKRSGQKDSHPGCFDISSAGHIPAGVDWVPSALRELEEELGLRMQAEQLHLAGVRRFDWKGSFYGKPGGIKQGLLQKVNFAAVRFFMGIFYVTPVPRDRPPSSG